MTDGYLDAEPLPIEPPDLQKHKRTQRTPTIAPRLPPHSIEAEQGVLGCALLSPRDSMGICEDRLTSDSFYDLRHRTIYETLSTMFKANSPIDLITVQQFLKDDGQLEAIGGLVYLSNLQDTVPSAAHLDHYIGIVVEKLGLRKMLAACSDSISRIYDNSVDASFLMGQVERDIISVTDWNAAQSAGDGICKPAKVVNQFVDDVQERNKRKGKLSGFRSGFVKLDEMTDGVQIAELFVIAARPSIGKTAIAVCMANHCCIQDGVPTLFVTLEMSQKAIMRRFVSILAEVPIKSIKTGQINEGESKRMANVTAKISKSPIYFKDGISGITISAVCSVIKRAVKLYGVKLVIVDYLQKVKPSEKQEKRTYEVAEVSNRLKAIAVSEKVAVIALAQLNRESEKEKDRPPRMTDLADSGQIERDADVLCLLHRKREDKKGEAALYVAKQRDGECGKVPLFFNGMFCRFDSQSYQPEPNE